MKTEIGKIFIDLGKLAFAGLVLAGLIRQDISPILLIKVGGTVTIVTIIVGLLLVWFDKKQ